MRRREDESTISIVGAARLASTVWRSARWLVIAPHPDDETLGAAALIADAAARGRLAGVAYLTDGAASHPHRTRASRAELKAARRSEARRACRILAGPGTRDPIFLDWPDARAREPGSAAYQKTLATLVAICRRRRVDAIAVTASIEPHGDHAAAGRLARVVAHRSLRPVVVFEYCVWGKPPQASTVVATRPIALGRRRAALAAHRSQLTPLFGDGFRLPESLRAMPARDLLYRVHTRSPRANRANFA